MTRRDRTLGRRPSRRLAPVLAGFMAAAALFAAGAARAAGNEISVSQSTDVLTLDPSVDSSAIGINAFNNIYDQLSRINPDGSLGPLLAESWEASTDQKTWTFKVRRNANFHDGTPVTVDDVIWSYRKILADSKSPVRAYLTQIAEMERLDDDRIRFTLKVPFVTFGRQVSLVSILPQKVYERLGAQRFSVAPIGSGPFKVVKWTKDSALELAANPDYWGGAPKVAKVFFKPVPSEASRAAALASGEIDIVPLLPPTLVESLGKRRGIKVEKIASNRVVFGGFNTGHPQLSNLKLRQAMDHAIDRDSISQKLLRGMGEPMAQIGAPFAFGYDPSLKVTTYDVALAKKLVAESGYKGEKILFQYPSNRWAFADQVAQALAGYFGAVGVNIELQPMEFSAFFPLWSGDKLQALYMFSLGITIADNDLLLNLEYETGTSHGYWTHPEVDRLIVAQRGESDPAKRKEMMARIWRLSQENAAFLPIYNEIQAYGVRDGVEWRPRPDERLMFKDASVSR